LRIALFSDIHGNIVGLEAVLAKLDALGGADVIYALGDFLAVGPGHEDLLGMLLTRQVRMIRGNWDEVFIDPEAHTARLPPGMRPLGLVHAEWLFRHVSPASRHLIATLPLDDTLLVAPGRRLFVCHAAPGDPWSRACEATTPTATLRAVYGNVEADVIAYGHYHAHHVIQLDGRLLLNVASVGMKRGGLSALTMLEWAHERWTVQQYQVPYDVERFERLTQERGVPPRL
jgi:predicted phosphodiesterase